MTVHADIRYYYRILGVAPNASSEDIKRSFRKIAKEIHPDKHLHNAAATAKFQVLNEAYAVLSDPESRAKYDAACIAEKEPEATNSQIEPVVCSSCGAISAQPRYVIFWYVVSIICWSSRRAIQGIFCRSCASKKAIKASAITWVVGWWGFPWGIMWTISSLYKNLLNGTQVADTNGQILGRQGLYFWRQGNINLAAAILDQALRFKSSQKLKESLSELRQAIPAKGVPPLIDKWKLSRSWAFWIQMLPMLAVVIFIVWVNRTDMLVAISKQNTAHIAEEKTPVLAEPNLMAPVIANVRPFEDFHVLEGRGEGSYERVITSHKIVGYIPKDLIVYGDGMTDLRQRCFPLGNINIDNGAILLQKLSGPHTMKAQNGLSSDAVVKLRDATGHTTLSFYVKANNQAIIENVPAGIYSIEFATGSEYSPTCGYFLSNMSSQRFLDTHTFETKYQDGSIYTSILEITLNPVSGGNAHTVITDDSNFDHD